MPYICTAVVATGVTVAMRVNRAGILGVTGVLYLNRSVVRKKPTIASVARRQHTIEHIDAAIYRVYQVLRRTDAHQIARLVSRHSWCDVVENTQHIFFRLANG